MKFLNRRMLSLAKNICAYGFVIGIALYPGIITTYRYYNTQKVNNPISQSRVIECKLFDVAPRKVEKLVSAIGEESKEELGTEGVDVLAKPPLGQLEEIANKSLPYIASALGHSKVYSPKVAIGYTGGSAGAYYFPIDEARVEDKVTIESSKRIIPHEIIHTQYNASTFLEAIKHAYHEFPFGFTNPPRFHDETFVEVATLEVLARQALDGDKLAKRAFAIRVGEALSLYLESTKHKKNKFAQEYFIMPAEIILDVLSCRKDSYDGIQLYSIRDFLQIENNRFKEIFPSTIKQANPN